MATKRARKMLVYKPLQSTANRREESNDPLTVPFPVFYEDREEWGPPGPASTRALLETKVNKGNKEFIRRYHPAFSAVSPETRIDLIWRDGSFVSWAVHSCRDFILGTHVCGLPVHVAPSYKNHHDPRLICSPSMDHLRKVDPRHILTEDDLDRIRLMYPRACGIRVWLSGSMQVLYPKAQDILDDRMEGVSSTVGMVTTRADVLRCYPSQQPTLHPGEGISEKIDSEQYNLKLKSVCMGLRILLPDGTPAITTATHGFVHVAKNTGPVSRVLNLFAAAKNFIRHFQAPTRHITSAPFLTTDGTSCTNTSVGKGVWLIDNNIRIGTITAMLDTPSHFAMFPNGYQHDLSLVTADTNDLPNVETLPGMPRIDGWGEITEALEGAPLFVTSVVPGTGPGKTETGSVWGANAREELKRRTCVAKAEGTQYLWDKETLSQTVSLLWRCVPPDKDMPQNQDEQAAARMRRRFRDLRGFSGSIVCIGRTTDTTAKALVFQSFQISGEEDLERQGDHECLYNIKGGFAVPNFIKHDCMLDTRPSSVVETSLNVHTAPRTRCSIDASH